MPNNQVIRACAETNARYMRDTPAGTTRGFSAVRRIYQRIADQSVVCATDYSEGRPCPEHDPAVDAFWWGVYDWSRCFLPHALVSLGHNPETISEEWEPDMQRFRVTHGAFANYLRPHNPPKEVTLGLVDMASPGRVILLLDASWTESVIRLAVRWGLLRHLKDLSALWQSLCLIRHLRRWPPDAIGRAYLESDILFLRELLGHFNFSPGLQSELDGFLDQSKAPIVNLT